METQVIVRVDPQLKKRVNSFAKAEGKTMSLVIRELLEGYVKNHDMSSYIDDLWNRIGSHIRKAGGTQKDIENVIREVREKV